MSRLDIAKSKFLTKAKHIHNNKYEYGIRAYQLEQWLIKRYSQFRYNGISPLNCGNTEMFIQDIRYKDNLIQAGDLVI